MKMESGPKPSQGTPEEIKQAEAMLDNQTGAMSLRREKAHAELSPEELELSKQCELTYSEKIGAIDANGQGTIKIIRGFIRGHKVELYSHVGASLFDESFIDDMPLMSSEKESALFKKYEKIAKFQTAGGGLGQDITRHEYDDYTDKLADDLLA